MKSAVKIVFELVRSIPFVQEQFGSAVHFFKSEEQVQKDVVRNAYVVVGHTDSSASVQDITADGISGYPILEVAVPILVVHRDAGVLEDFFYAVGERIGQGLDNVQVVGWSSSLSPVENDQSDFLVQEYELAFLYRRV